MSREKIVKKIYSEIIKPYLDRGYKEEDYTMFSFGSCNTDDCRDVSDIDMTLLLEKDYLREKIEPSNNKSLPKFYAIRQKMADIENEFKKSANIELHLHIGDFSFIDKDEPRTAIPSLNYELLEGWGNLAKHYRLFYDTISGKTESGRRIIEQIKLNPDIFNIPRHEGEELYAACKRDMAESFLSGITMQETNNYEGLRHSSNKMAKSLLRAVEALKLRLGGTPSWDENRRSLYRPMLENGKVIFEEAPHLQNLLEQALEVKLTEGKTYGFDTGSLNNFGLLFQNLSEKFFDEIKIEKGFMPKENYDDLKRYSISTGKRITEELIKHLDKSNRWPVLFIAGEEIVGYLEQEYAQTKNSGNKENIEKLEGLFNIIEAMGTIKQKFHEQKNIEETRYCLMLAGRMNILREKYAEAEKYLEKTLEEHEPIGFSQFYNAVLLKRLAYAKVKLNKKEEARKIIEKAARINPLDAETWGILSSIDDDQNSKLISECLIKDENHLDTILSNENINTEGIKKFFSVWNDYIFNNLSVESERLREYSSDLDKRMDNVLDDGGCPYLKAVNLLSDKEADLFKKLSETTTFYLNTIQEGQIISEKQYKKFLEFRWDSYKSIMVLESLIQNILKTKCEAEQNSPGEKKGR